MKKIRLFALMLVVMMTLASFSVLAEGEFIPSVGAYSSKIVVIKADPSGDSDKDIVAEHLDADGKLLYDVERIRLTIVDSNDDPTASNELALKRIDDAIEEITKDGGVKGLISGDTENQLKNLGINVDSLAVGVAFDVTYSRELKGNEILEFTIENPAVDAMGKSDTYTGKLVILQQNTETGKYEALTLSTADPLPAGCYSVDGDHITIAVNHLCVFLVAAEAVKTTPTPTPSGSSIQWWVWVLIAVAALLVLFIIIIIVGKRKKDDDEEEKKNAAANK